MDKKFHIIYKTFIVDDDERKSFYKICAKTNARIVAMAPSKCHLGYRTPSSYTLEFRDKKSSEKFSKLLQKNPYQIDYLQIFGLFLQYLG